MITDSLTFRLALLTSAAVAVSSCGGGSSSSSPAPAPAAANVAQLVVDGGPTVGGTINQAYVTITVCVPGTSTCQDIDHVWVDTGSSGLRLIASSFTASLPTSKDGSGNVIANCAQFVSSYSWGAVRTADVKIAGKSASSVPIQVIADSAVPATAPGSCATGSPLTMTSQLGANGLLGIGVFQQDCGPGCASSAVPAFYYTCPGGTCGSVTMATNLQLQNVVGLFTTDNNGSLIQLPALTASGAATATGSLIFGINTQTNNQMGTGVVAFAADPGLTVGSNPGDIKTTTTYGDMSEPASYIDSGSNGYFFNNSSITACTGANTGFFCPSSPVMLSATMLPYNSSTPSFTYSFTIVHVATFTGNAANNIGGPGGSCTGIPCTFDWGLPFFYGRSVFTALEGTTIAGNTGPFFAASTP